MIIDTDVLIWFLRGNEKAVNEIINAGSFDTVRHCDFSETEGRCAETTEAEPQSLRSNRFWKE